MEPNSEPTINYLTELMNVFKNQTPSSPAWFQIIDQVVGTLLAAEIARAEARLREAADEIERLRVYTRELDLLNRRLEARLLRLTNEQGEGR